LFEARGVVICWHAGELGASGNWARLKSLRIGLKTLPPFPLRIRTSGHRLYWSGMVSSSFGICNMATKMNSAERGVIVALMLFFASSCAIPEFQATDWSTYRAVVHGKTGEALASLEAQAQEAEKNVSASWFPQGYWIAATAAYNQASTAAMLSGQLEKSIALGEKA